MSSTASGARPRTWRRLFAKDSPSNCSGRILTHFDLGQVLGLDRFETDALLKRHEVAWALLSITLHPLLFRAIDPLERWLRGKPRVWRTLSRRAELGGAELNLVTGARLAEAGQEEQPVTAVIVGYGPVGQTACRILKEFDVRPVVDPNFTVDTVRGLFVHQMIGIVPDKPRELYRIPEGFEPKTSLAIGCAADPDALPEKYRERDLAPRTRKPLAEFDSTLPGYHGKAQPPSICTAPRRAE